MPKVNRPDWLSFDPWLPVGQLNAPIYTLPDGRFFSTVNKYLGAQNSSIVGRAGVKSVFYGNGANNVTHWTHSSVANNTGKSPSDQLDGNGNRLYIDNLNNVTDQDMINLANGAPLALLYGDDWLEGQFFADPASNKIKVYYQRLKERCQAAGIPFRAIGPYGSPILFNIERWNFLTNGSETLPNAQQFKNYIATQQSARNASQFYSIYGDGLLIPNVKNYADRTDYAVQYYGKKFAVEVHCKAVGRQGGLGGSEVCYLDWGKIESLGNTLTGNFYYERRLTNPAGNYATETHPRMDYDLQVANIFVMGFLLGGVYFPFDEPDQFGTDWNKVRQFAAQWTPDVPGTPVPSVQNGYYPFEPYRWIDAGYEASWYYYNCTRTEGIPWQYLKYSIDGGTTWINPVNDGTDILEHASAFGGPFTETGRRGRPDAMFRIKNNALDFYVFDPSRRKGSYETIIVEPVAGKQFSINLEGSKLYVYNETI